MQYSIHARKSQSDFPKKKKPTNGNSVRIPKFILISEKWVVIKSSIYDPSHAAINALHQFTSTIPQNPNYARHPRLQKLRNLKIPPTETMRPSWGKLGVVDTIYEEEDYDRRSSSSSSPSLSRSLSSPPSPLHSRIEAWYFL